MIRRLVDALTMLCGWGLVVFSLGVGVEIVGRRYLGFSLQGVDEVGGYLMAVAVAAGFSCALYDRAHIRIDLLLGHVPGRLAMCLNVLALVGLFVFAVFLASRGLLVLTESYQLEAVSSTPLLTPMVVPQSIWVGSLVLFAIVSLSCAVRALRHALRGEAEAVESLIGTSSARPPARDNA